jgi:outer membrane protein OmpA-like peptidoglycan-associated protein
MRKIFICFFAAVALFFVGCGKREKKDSSLAQSAVETKSQIPVYKFEADEFFDDKDVTELAFVDGKEVADAEDSDEKAISASDSEVSSFDDWDDDKMSFAFEEEQSVAEGLGFEVVNFDLNKNNIRDDQKVRVAKNVESADKAVKLGKKVIVAGHTCELGAASYNMSLSERRAKAVRDEMVKKGVPEKKIKILGCGSEVPIVLSDAKDREEKIEELSLNRRAEVSLN